MSDYLLINAQARRIFEGPLFGRNVTLVRTLIGGASTREIMPAGLAAYEAIHGTQNGITVMSAHIELWDEIDQWGSSA